MRCSGDEAMPIRRPRAGPGSPTRAWTPLAATADESTCLTDSGDVWHHWRDGSCSSGIEEDLGIGAATPEPAAAGTANACPSPIDVVWGGPALEVLEDRLATVQEAHRQEVETLRLALQECMVAVGTCAQAVIAGGSPGGGQPAADCALATRAARYCAEAPAAWVHAAARLSQAAEAALSPSSSARTSPLRALRPRLMSPCPARSLRQPWTLPAAAAPGWTSPPASPRVQVRPVPPPSSWGSPLQPAIQVRAVALPMHPPVSGRPRQLVPPANILGTIAGLPTVVEMRRVVLA